VGEKTDPGDSLSVPGNRLRIVPKSRSVVVNWNGRSGGAVSYNLYYSSVKGFDPDDGAPDDGAVVSLVTAPTEITGLINGRAYYFVLEAVYATETVRSAETASRPGELVFNNLVDDIVLAPDGTRYVGGKFTGVGTATGGGVPVHFTTGKLIAGDFPQVNDRIFAVVPDGQGGWYIGGRFTQVGSEKCQNLAHILSDLSVDENWKPTADGDVKALAVKDNIVFAGGNFKNIGGASRERLAAIGADGVALDWGLDADRSVNALAVSGSTVYVGGDFSTVGGNVLNGLAAINIDETTGIGAPDTGWDPDAGGGGVNALSAEGDIVYAGGDFITVGGVTRNRLAAIVANGDNRGSVTDWDPNVEDGSVNALAVSGNILYMGGSFTAIGGVGRNSLAAINTVNAGVRPRWNPNANREVRTLAVIGNVIYVGGRFTALGGEVRNRLAALEVADGKVTRWNPQPNNNVNALAVSGDAVYVGGILTTIGSAFIERNRLAAIGIDGNFTRWNPSIGGTGSNGNAPNIITLAYSDNTIYAGGNFTEVNGAAFKNLVAIGTDGRVNTNWTPNPDKTARTLTLDNNGVLYAGGDFTRIGGANRSLLAAINPDGTLTGWNPAANGAVHTLAISSGIVYIGGRFTEINGTARGKLAAVGTGGNQDNVLLGWNPNLGVENDIVARSLTVSGSSVYVGGAFTGVGGNTGFANLASIDINGTVNTGWTPQVDEDVIMLTVANNTVYVGGSFNTIDGNSRRRLGAIAIGSGSVTNWNPGIPSGNVLALLVEGSTVYAGGSFRFPREFLWSGYGVFDANTGELK